MVRQANVKKRRGCGCLAALLALAIFVVVAGLTHLNRERREARPVPGAAVARVWIDSSFTPAAVPGAVAPHPFLAAGGNATMHGDAYQSDSHPVFGPFGQRLEVRSRLAGNGLPRQCATQVFRSDGRIMLMCGGIAGFRMVLLDPDTLAALAYYDLPMRPSAFEALVRRDMAIMMNDSSGGAYLFLDNRDRLGFVDSKLMVQRLEARQTARGWELVVDRQWDLKPYVPHDCFNWNNLFPSGECDRVTTVMPDHKGLYWWTTRNGRLGTLDPETGRVRSIRLVDEEIQNALAMDEDGAYLLSDHAQYAFRAGADGTPVQLWRHAYDRGSRRKVGSINQGSGTTPTLIGQRWITFADNADGRINVVVLRRGALAPGEQRQICKVPVFRDGASATDNSMIGWGRSIIMENNAGYESAHTQKDWNAIAGGVVRIDIRSDESGCDVVWNATLRSPSVVPKLAVKNGIAYFYSFESARDAEGREVQDWSIVGLDFATGHPVIRIPTGRGKAFDNNWSALSLSPRGDLYVGVNQGLVQVRQK